MWSNNFVMRFIFLIVTVLLFGLGNYEVTSASLIPSLRAQKFMSTLPREVEGAAIIYDGKDSIYLFGGGGRQSTPSDSILKYSLSSSTVERLPTTLPFPGYGMSAVSHTNGSIYIFGTYNGRGVVLFDPATYQATSIATMSQDVSYTPTIKYNTSNVVVFFRSTTPEIVEINLNTLEQTEISLNLGKGRKPSWDSATQGFLLNGGNEVFLFRQSRTNSQSLIKVDLNSFSSQLGPSNHLIRRDASTVVYDGNFMYRIGGFDSRAYQTNAIVQYNTTTMEHKYLSVDNYLVCGSRFLIDAPSAVYVKKENRIYLFGGTTGTSWALRQSWSFHRDIYYIDLNVLGSSMYEGYDSDEYDTDTTFVNRGTDGSIIRKVIIPSKRPTYEIVPPSTTVAIPIGTMKIRCSSKFDFMPHPDNCSLFIGCENWIPKVYNCQPPLLFDAKIKNCHHPELAKCSLLSCSGKSDGLYAHPMDCSKFYTCHGGNLLQHHCTPPFMFDVQLGRCNFKELVTC